MAAHWSVPLEGRVQQEAIVLQSWRENQVSVSGFRTLSTDDNVSHCPRAPISLQRNRPSGHLITRSPGHLIPTNS